MWCVLKDALFNLVPQITEVLVGLSLKQYVGVVQEEALDGGILVELDEETLITELGMTSRIHRLKIMKLIGGDYDARTYIEQSTSV